MYISRKTGFRCLFRSFWRDEPIRPWRGWRLKDNLIYEEDVNNQKLPGLNPVSSRVHTDLSLNKTLDGSRCRPRPRCVWKAQSTPRSIKGEKLHRTQPFYHLDLCERDIMDIKWRVWLFHIHPSIISHRDLSPCATVKALVCFKCTGPYAPANTCLMVTEWRRLNECVLWLLCAPRLQMESSSLLHVDVCACGVVAGRNEPQFTWEQMTGYGLANLSVKRWNKPN